MLGLHCCAWTLTNRGCSLGGVQGLLIARPLIKAASTVAEQKLKSVSSVLRCTGLVAAWWGDGPRPGMEPVSPALVHGFLTTAPLGKPNEKTLKLCST